MIASLAASHQKKKGAGANILIVQTIQTITQSSNTTPIVPLNSPESKYPAQSSSLK